MTNKSQARCIKSLREVKTRSVIREWYIHSGRFRTSWRHGHVSAWVLGWRAHDGHRTTHLGKPSDGSLSQWVVLHVLFYWVLLLQLVLHHAERGETPLQTLRETLLCVGLLHTLRQALLRLPETERLVSSFLGDASLIGSAGVNQAAHIGVGHVVQQHAVVGKAIWLVYRYTGPGTISGIGSYKQWLNIKLHLIFLNLYYHISFMLNNVHRLYYRHTANSSVVTFPSFSSPSGECNREIITKASAAEPRCHDILTWVRAERAVGNACRWGVTQPTWIHAVRAGAYHDPTQARPWAWNRPGGFTRPPPRRRQAIAAFAHSQRHALHHTHCNTQTNDLVQIIHAKNVCFIFRF